MTIDRPTFGEFLAAAYGHLSAAAVAQRDKFMPGRDVDYLADAVAHVAVVLSRYTADITRMIGDLPDKQLAQLGKWDRAALQSHDALVSAVEALGREARTDWHADGATNQAVLRLHAAARSLAAGRDLLQGHFSTDPAGARLYKSNWSPAITSPNVSRAMLSEVSSLALQTAAVIPAELPPSANDKLRRLNAARYWLAQPDACVHAAEPSQLTSDGREVLRAVPANAMPARPVPEDLDYVPELCNAVVAASERARRSAWAATTLEGSSAAISVTSWHRISAASTVTSHHCHLLFTTVARRVAEEHAGQLSGDLERAAADASRAREYWLDSAREFQEVTTDVRGHISPAALEAADLALWTGRLAYADPEWALSRPPSQSVRPGRNLVPELAHLPGVLGAIHEASDALRSLAAANLDQVRKSVEAKRVLVATRLLSARHDIPLAFTPAPEANAASLVACCEDTARAAARAADTGAGIASYVGAPSRTLVAARAAARDQPETRRPAGIVRAKSRDAEAVGVGPLERRLRTLGVTSTRNLWRASAIDRAAEQVFQDGTASLKRRGSRASESAASSAPGTQLLRGDRSSFSHLEHLEAEP